MNKGLKIGAYGVLLGALTSMLFIKDGLNEDMRAVLSDEDFELYEKLTEIANELANKANETIRSLVYETD